MCGSVKESSKNLSTSHFWTPSFQLQNNIKKEGELDGKIWKNTVLDDIYVRKNGETRKEMTVREKTQKENREQRDCE